MTSPPSFPIRLPGLVGFDPFPDPPGHLLVALRGGQVGSFARRRGSFREPAHRGIRADQLAEPPQIARRQPDEGLGGLNEKPGSGSFL